MDYLGGGGGGGEEGGKGYVGLPLKLLGGGTWPPPLPTPKIQGWQKTNLSVRVLIIDQIHLTLEASNKNYS